MRATPSPCLSSYYDATCSGTHFCISYMYIFSRQTGFYPKAAIKDYNNNNNIQSLQEYRKESGVITLEKVLSECDDFSPVRDIIFERDKKKS